MDEMQLFTDVFVGFATVFSLLLSCIWKNNTWVNITFKMLCFIQTFAGAVIIASRILEGNS
jgi:hypothetical protein